MKFETFSVLFTVLYNQNKIQQNYLDKIPEDIQSAFCENTYTNSIEIVNDMLMKHVFEDNIEEDIYCYLYEFNSKNKHTSLKLDDTLTYFKNKHFSDEI
jgi:hypothetical protein